MMKIREITPKEKEVINRVVQIHLDTFKGFFLTFLGRGFLHCLYKSYCEHNESSLLVACEDEEPVGFLAYSGDYSALYRYMLKRRLLPFAWYSFCAFIRKPKAFFRLIRAFLKPNDVKRKERYVELSSIGVKPSMKSKGIGSMLINELKLRVDFGRYSYIALETDAENNEAANYFYTKNGFVLERTYETREGRKMNEYRYEKKATV